MAGKNTGSSQDSKSTMEERAERERGERRAGIDLGGEWLDFLCTGPGASTLHSLY
jgi:hypothetical protein